MKHLVLRIIALSLMGIVVITVLGIAAYLLLPRRVRISKDEISVHASGIHPANQKQYNASVYMFPYDDMLYFCSNLRYNGGQIQL